MNTKQFKTEVDFCYEPRASKEITATTSFYDAKLINWAHESQVPISSLFWLPVKIPGKRFSIVFLIKRKTSQTLSSKTEN